MYFVTGKRTEYVLFCTTPSERAAVGLTEKQAVHLLVRPPTTETWRVLREWNADIYSHTEFMAQLRAISEPADPNQLVDFLPAHLR